MVFFSEDGITIFHGECIEILRGLDAVELRTVCPAIHVITDPPYSEHVHSKSRRGGEDLLLTGQGRRTRAGISRVRDLGFESLSSELRRACAAQFAELSDRWVLVFCDLESAHLWREDLERAELEHVRIGIWRKLNATPQFTGDRPATACEAIEIAHAPGRKRWNGGGKHGIWEHSIAINRDGSSPRHHTTEKPVALMRDLIRDFTDPGDLILDPFMGSGTTLVAARDMGRRAIGIEQSLEYCETAKRRLSDLLLPFDGPTSRRARLTSRRFAFEGATDGK